MILTYQDFLKISPKTIEGTVISASNGQAVDKAFCYIIKGNEEIVTNNRGEFRIKTWQEFPLTITIEHSDYETETVKITSAQTNIKIHLRKK